MQHYSAARARTLATRQLRYRENGYTAEQMSEIRRESAFHGGTRVERLNRRGRGVTFEDVNARHGGWEVYHDGRWVGDIRFNWRDTDGERRLWRGWQFIPEDGRCSPVFLHIESAGQAKAACRDYLTRLWS